MIASAAQIAYWLARCTEGEGGCLLWPGAIDGSSRGRGVPSVHVGRNRKRSLRRLLLEHQLGRPLRPKMTAMCRCDVQRCVAREHLFEATPRQRSHPGRPKSIDKRLVVARGRQRSRTAKLDWQRVRAIREQLAQGARERELAAAFGVSRRMIGFIRHNKAWRVASPFSV